MIDLPANVQWVTPDLAVAVIPGDTNGWETTVYGLAGKRRFVAPREWVQYDKPCERCNGFGKTEPASFMRGMTMPCPDCRDGRQVWEVRWPDPAYYSPPNMNWLSARGTMQVVPVVGLWPRPGDVPCYYNGASGHPAGLFLVARQPQVPFVLDPLPVVGRDWVLVVRRQS